MADYIQYALPLILNSAKYFLLAGMPFLVFYVLFPDVFSKNKIQTKFAKKKDFLREISFSVQTIFVLTGVALLMLKTPLRDYTQFYGNPMDYPLWWIPISVLLALIVQDTYFYWMHRSVHHPKVFRTVHLVHHKSVNPSPWASFSFHFFEAVLEAMIAPIILLLIPMNTIALILFGFVSFGINVYGHLGFEIAPKWFRHSFLFELLVTSTHHNMHHAKFKGNYGLYFRIWDRMMGTEHPEYVKEYDKIQRHRFGEYRTSYVPKRSILSAILMLTITFLTVSATSSSKDGIEGKWMFRENGVVVEIYEKDGLYFGELIETSNEEDNKKIQEHGKVILLKDFEKESETSYCCGTLFAPKKGMTLDATMTLEDSNRIRIHVRYGLLSGSEILVKL